MARDSMQEGLRARLRELRTARGLTLEEVGSRAGLSASAVSRLESGARRLAVDHLPLLAGALGVTTDELLAPVRTADPRIRTPARQMCGMTVWPLSRHGPAAGPRAFKLLIPADRAAPEPRSHEGHEWLFVLSGRLRLVLGEDDLLLEPGEAAEFSTWTPHWMGAVDGPVEVLALLGPHGERAHLRAGASPRAREG